MNRRYELDPMGVILLSARQVLGRIYFWIRLAVWRLFFSLFIISAPAAKAGFYHGLAEGLRDPFETEVNVRAAFVRGFFEHLGRGTLLGFLNLLALVVLVQGFLFWSVQESFGLNLLAGIVAAFFLYWWMCQPLLYPALIDLPDRSTWQVIRAVFALVNANLLYVFVLAFSLSFLVALSIVLVGPLSLISVPLLGLVATQGYWVLKGQRLPDLIDPVEYAALQEAARRGETADAEQA